MSTIGKDKQLILSSLGFSCSAAFFRITLTDLFVKSYSLSKWVV